MPLIDISVALREGTPEWPGDTPFSCRWAWDTARGNSVNVSSLTASPHVGTHADAPLHLQHGWPGAAELAIDAFVGPAVVVDVEDCVGEIAVERLRAVLDPHRLLLRTTRSIATGSFPASWPVLSFACANALLDRGLVLLGVDAPSVDDRESRGLPIHRLLFERGAMILENLDLRDVEPGAYELLAAPVKIDGADAAPVRAMLRTLRES